MIFTKIKMKIHISSATWKNSKIILAIVCSRNINNYEIVGKYLNQFTKISKIVSGGANGVDKLAERFATEHSIPILIMI